MRDDASRDARSAGDDRIERVAVFGEDDDRLARSDRAADAADRIFELVRQRARQRDQALEQPRALPPRSFKPARRQHRIRLDVVGVIRLFPRQRRLGRFGARRRRAAPAGDAACAAIAAAEDAARRAIVMAIKRTARSSRPRARPDRPRVVARCRPAAPLPRRSGGRQHMRAPRDGEADVAAAPPKDRDRIAAPRPSTCRYSNAARSPECGVADTNTHHGAREASRDTAAPRSVPGAR